MGRTRTADRFAPRTIDLDIILYGQQVINEQDMVIPDPDISRRSFVAVPLLELAPDLILPGSGTELFTLKIIKCKEDLEPLPRLTERLAKRIENNE